ncbi:MAG: ATP-binding protein, partial [Halothece sp. Uz-M2-17]|nr:ATP-binding protein [Halothece sp. Uz-M2-17]
IEDSLNRIHPDDRNQLQQCLERAIATGTPYELEFRIYRFDGTVITVLGRGEPVLSDKNQVTHLVGTVQDQTAQKLAEQELQAAKQSAEAANRAKSQFLALITHELRTPMNAVLGLSDLALRTPLNLTQRDYLTKIKTATTSLLDIINDILDLSKIEAEKLELESVSFELQPVFNQIEHILALKAAEKGLALIFEVEGNVPRYLQGDPLRLRQVLLNLVGNAVKFTETGSIWVKVKALSISEATVRLKFEVQDTGIGLTTAQIATLFDPFTQADVSTSHKYSGTGLGLAICKRLVTLMGGNIGVTSQPQQGSTFSFDIELGYNSAQQRDLLLPHQDQTDALSVETRVRQTVGGSHILLVEDNEVNQFIIQELLQSIGIKVDVVVDGQSAIAQVQAFRYDLILMDIQLPQIDGLEATRQIRAMARDTGKKYLATVPIIALSAYTMNAVRDQSLQAGMNDHISKPVSPETLFQALLQWIPPKEQDRHWQGNQEAKSYLH